MSLSSFGYYLIVVRMLVLTVVAMVISRLRCVLNRIITPEFGSTAECELVLEHRQLLTAGCCTAQHILCTSVCSINNITV